MALPDPKSSPATDPGGTGYILSSWPLVIVIEDCYVPESARLVLEVVGDLDEASCAATWKIAAIYADVSGMPKRWN